MPGDRAEFVSFPARNVGVKAAATALFCLIVIAHKPLNFALPAQKII